MLKHESVGNSCFFHSFNLSKQRKQLLLNKLNLNGNLPPPLPPPPQQKQINPLGLIRHAHKPRSKRTEHRQKHIVVSLTVSFIWIWLILIRYNLCLKSSLNWNLSPSSTSLPCGTQQQNVNAREKSTSVFAHSLLTGVRKHSCINRERYLSTCVCVCVRV